METTARPRAAATPSFEDGFGTRHHLTGPDGELLDVLILNERIAATPDLEQKVRERIDRLAAVQHPSHGRVRGVAGLARNQRGFGIISERVPGIRLSRLLAGAEQGQRPLDMTAALSLINQLTSAVARLHDMAPAISHGAIAPERIVITPDGRLVLVEHVLGAVTTQLNWSGDEYWKALRVALPPFEAAPAFDHRTDVAQIGAVALALLLGHPLGDDYPTQVRGWSRGSTDPSPALALELLPDGVRGWISRALQVNARFSFTSAVEANAALDSVLDDAPDSRTTPASLKALLVARHEPAPVPLPSVAPAPVPAPAPRLEAPARVAFEPELADEFDTETSDEAVDDAVDERFAALARLRSWGRQRLIAAVAVVLVVASATTFTARRYYRSAPAGDPPGVLVVNSAPPGAMIVVDGVKRGETPLRVDVAAGDHVMELSNDVTRRTIPFSIASGAQLSQFVDLPAPVAVNALGQVQIRTEPSGARIKVDGQSRGQSPLTVDRLDPGPHTVLVESDTGSVTERVIVEAGATVSLVVPLAAAPAAAASGWIDVKTPAEVQLYEDRRFLGSSRSERLMMPVGRHDLEIVSEALGYRVTRTVNVTAGQVTRLVLDWPNGALAVNASPWADVWIDGERAGETPIGNMTVPIGSHELLFRHPELGEKRYTAVVTLGAPVRVSVDLRN